VEAFNILVLSSWYPHRYDPFLGNFVKRHCEAIARSHRVWVIHVVNVSEKGQVGEERHSNGNLTEIIIYRKRSPLSFIDYQVKKRRISDAIRKEGISFDLLHAHVLYPLAPLFARVAQKLGIPWVFSEHWSGFHREFRPAIPAWKWSWITRRASTAQRGFPVSQNLAHSLSEIIPSVPLFPIPNVVSDVFFEKQVESEDLHGGKVKFLHVSTLDEPYKNISGTLEAFAELKASGKDFRFLIISDGNTQLAESEVMRLGLTEEVEIRGAATSEEIAEEMLMSDAFVLFSNTENQPCVVLESLSLGLPVIASSVGDLPNLITPEKGLLVRRGDTKDLSQKLLAFVERRNDFSGADVSRGARESFSYDAVSGMLSDHYREVLKENH